MSETQSTAARPVVSTRYITCLAILVISAAGMQVVAQQFAAYFEKEGLPLRKALHLLEVGKLAPTYSTALRQPRPLTKELIENLGTDEYLNCFLTDNDADPRETDYYAKLFVTYYTGQPDMVPHAPRECQQAAGYSLKEAEMHVLKLLDHKGNEVDLPMEVLVFDPPDGSSNSLTVIFFFYANGEYVTTREQVRVATSDLRDKYAYYAKVELAFTSKRGMPADKETSMDAGDRLLRKLMPILWKEHFPDWEAATSGTVAGAEKT